ncbi:MAG: ArsI/CadI family heavy metal resistance metalloenzyme [Acidimicrobiales bacterium]|jgi:catechol 2,3-dioxygenase-like lactoylglutathione lyase family enzyme
MSRVQLALNVADMDGAVEFYSKLFGTGPAKRRPGYANFVVVDPPLKLVLLEKAVDRGHGTVGALNHLGIEVEAADDVTAATARLSGEGLDAVTEEATSCCYAIQDKVWVEDPDGAPWEVYTVLADDPDATAPLGNPVGAGTACCHDTSVAAAGPAACC